MSGGASTSVAKPKRTPRILITEPIEGGYRVSLIGWLKAEPSYFPDRANAVRFAAVLADIAGLSRISLPRCG